MPGGELLRSNLEEVIRASDPLAAWHVSETPCGLIAAFTREADAEKLLQRGDLARVFEGPVQVDRINTVAESFSFFFFCKSTRRVLFL